MPLRTFEFHYPSSGPDSAEFFFVHFCFCRVIIIIVIVVIIIISSISTIIFYTSLAAKQPEYLGEGKKDP